MSSTISEKISKHLSESIVTGSIEPGTKLDEVALADQFHASRTPVRDALRQLAATGLVEFRPRRGVTVIDIGSEKLYEMFETQSELEGLCARMSAQRMTGLERRKLESLHGRIKQIIDDKDTAEYSGNNETFHDLIYRGAHNDSIRELTISFRQRLAPFRSAVFFNTQGRIEESYQEHCKIVEAILSGDPDRAYQETRAHVLSSSVNVIDYLARRHEEKQASS